MLRRSFITHVPYKICGRISSSSSSLLKSTNVLFVASRPTSSWGYAEVDQDGKTELDRKYEESAERIRQQFAQPIILPDQQQNAANNNTEKECDFLIGFSQYRYTMRDTYRKTIALALNEIEGGAELLKELNEFDQKQKEMIIDQTSETKPTSQKLFSPMNIDLSVAWKGRFAMHKFRGCHKVVGVSLISMLSQIDIDNNNKTPSSDGTTPMRIKAVLPDTPTKAKAISSLVNAINSQRTLIFIEAGITRAAPRDVLSSMSSANGTTLNGKNKSNTNNNFTSTELQHDEEFQILMRRVEREIKTLSKKNKVVIFFNSQSEAATMDKLRPIVFAAKVAPVMINIDDFKNIDNNNNNDHEEKIVQDENQFPQTVSSEEIEKYGRRTIVLNALSGFYFRSGNNHHQDVSRENPIDDYGKRKLERTTNVDDEQRNGKTQRIMKFPLIFINGNYFGTASHLLRMQDESKKLHTLIHSPGDLKMKPYTKFSI